MTAPITRLGALRHADATMAMPSKKPNPLSIDQLAIDTIRTLSMDAVEAAKSGHPGTPMALAPVAYTLWQHFLRFNPDNPRWPNRDRFVLSAGHASMLLYSLLHLAGVKDDHGQPAVSLDDIKRFRQLGSRCRVIPNTGTPRAWKPPRGLWVRAAVIASGWRSRSVFSPNDTTGKVSRCSITGFTRSAATVT
jgi:transketolase N-terminal domain/subunit